LWIAPNDYPASLALLEQVGVSLLFSPQAFKNVKRPVAIIKIWNLETEKRKVPKLFYWINFWKLFRKPKFHFQKKN